MSSRKQAPGSFLAQLSTALLGGTLGLALLLLAVARPSDGGRWLVVGPAAALAATPELALVDSPFVDGWLVQAPARATAASVYRHGAWLVLAADRFPACGSPGKNRVQARRSSQPVTIWLNFSYSASPSPQG